MAHIFIFPLAFESKLKAPSVNGKLIQKHIMHDFSIWALLLIWPFAASAGQHAAQTQDQVVLEASAPASWWYFGDTVLYRYEKGALEKAQKVTGRIFDTGNKEVAVVEVSVEELLQKGWSWKPTSPGLYEVEFSQVISGTRVPFSSRYQMRAPSGKSREFIRERYQFAVAAEKAAPNYKRGQFGFTYHYTESDIPLAKLMGFDFAFFHSFGWGAHFLDLNKAIEPEKGSYRWEIPDVHIKALSDTGFQIGAQFLYTPAWASPHPELVNKINTCVREATAFAPKDLNDFTTFVQATVERYEDRIGIWEIWNEPNLPGSSCFWSDTPESYFRLLKAGYETIKKAQPEAEVWIGGLGPRRSYHAFYNRILKLGASNYFDVLSLHGTWNSPEIFQDIDTRNKAGHKPSVMSEWHAILVGNGQGPPIPTEQELSLRMLSDLLYQLKRGIKRSVLFQMTGNVEKEAIPFINEEKWFNHSSGLFRVKPRLEPRLPAVTMQAFITRAGNAAEYVKEGRLPSGLSWVLLKTARGPLMVCWVEKDTPAPAALAGTSPEKKGLYNWENKPLGKSVDTILKPGILYYLTDVPSEISEDWQTEDVLTNPRMVKPNQGTAPEGHLMIGRLFEKTSSPAIPQSQWINKGWLPKPEGSTITDLHPRFACGISEGGLDLVVEVKDKVHFQNSPDPDWWHGDSIQFAIDCEGAGLFGGHAEFIAALTKDGPKIWKMTAADVGGDIPVDWSPANSAPKNVDLSIERKGNTTTYKARIPWSEIYPLVYDPSSSIRFSLLVNNSDGASRQYIEWASGIGNGNDKDPSQYGTLTPSGN